MNFDLPTNAKFLMHIANCIVIEAILAMCYIYIWWRLRYMWYILKEIDNDKESSLKQELNVDKYIIM